MLKKNITIFTLSCILFRGLLDISYYNVVFPVYEYAGYTYNYEFTGYIVSWILFLFAVKFTPYKIQKVSDYFFLTALLLVIAPLSTLYAFDSQNITPLAVTIFTIYTITKIVSLLPENIKIPIVKNGYSIALGISLMFVVFLVIWYPLSGAIPNFNMMKVYDFRNINMKLSAYGVFGYTNNWTHNVFNIILISYFLRRKKYFFTLIFILIQFYFFIYSTNKIVFFIPFLIFSIWLFFRKTNNSYWFVFFFSVVILTTILSYILFEDIYLSAFFSNRVFFIPAHLTYSYFDFFSSNPRVYWSNSVLKYFLEYPYDLSMTHVIGRYEGNPDMGANNGFISSGFAHAGYWGVIIYTLITGIILNIIDLITYKRLPLWFSISLVAVPFSSFLLSSDLLTTGLTHGLLLIILLLFFLRENTYK